MQAEILLRLITTLSEYAANQIRNGRYWERELQVDIARIRQTLNDLEREMERR
jgi:dimeric dUTPase (all-alpha-NTP-PPase superfamily)